MRIDLAKTILAAGRRFGRFAVLLLLPPVAIIMTLWFSLMEEHLGWFLASAFVVLPIVMITIAFLVGMLFAGFWRKKIRGSVDRKPLDCGRLGKVLLGQP